MYLVSIVSINVNDNEGSLGLFWARLSLGWAGASDQYQAAPGPGPAPLQLHPLSHPDRGSRSLGFKFNAWQENHRWLVWFWWLWWVSWNRDWSSLTSSLDEWLQMLATRLQMQPLLLALWWKYAIQQFIPLNSHNSWYDHVENSLLATFK